MTEIQSPGFQEAAIEFAKKPFLRDTEGNSFTSKQTLYQLSEYLKKSAEALAAGGRQEEAFNMRKAAGDIKTLHDAFDDIEHGRNATRSIALLKNADMYLESACMALETAHELCLMEERPIINNNLSVAQRLRHAINRNLGDFLQNGHLSEHSVISQNPLRTTPDTEIASDTVHFGQARLSTLIKDFGMVTVNGSNPDALRHYTVSEIINATIPHHLETLKHNVDAALVRGADSDFCLSFREELDNFTTRLDIWNRNINDVLGGTPATSRHHAILNDFPDLIDRYQELMSKAFRAIDDGILDLEANEETKASVPDSCTAMKQGFEYFFGDYTKNPAVQGGQSRH